MPPQRHEREYAYTDEHKEMNTTKINYSTLSPDGNFMVAPRGQDPGPPQITNAMVDNLCAKVSKYNP